MRIKSILGIMLAMLTLAIVGCGGGGGGAKGTVVSGKAVKGPISGGTVQVFEVISSGTTAPSLTKPRLGTTAITSTTTAADGSFTVVIPSGINKSGLLFKLTGGSYKDEATGATVQVNAQAANGLRAVFGNISGIARRGGAITTSITPLTELGVQTLGANAPSDANIAAANAKVATTFGLPDFLTTQPLDFNAAAPAGATQAQKDYTLALATLSQRQATSSLTVDQLAAVLLPDVNAGTGLSPANVAANQQAQLTVTNSPNNLSGIPAPAVTVVVSPATATAAAINTNRAITATVKQGGINVPDGTAVKFAITSGTGGTLSAATATTTNGVASVNLTSATDAAAYVVTATAGGVSAATGTITFTDPNKPGAISLLASPNRGAINGLLPVTLTATVTPADPVNGTLTANTPVTFTIVSGTGTLSSATANTNNNGVATVTLNSTAVGTVVVKAAAGTAPVVSSTNVNVPFIVQPTLVTVKVATTGTLPANTLIGGVNAIVTANPSSGLTIAPSDVALSGVGLGSLLTPNTSNVAAVNLALITTNGIQVGEFATLTYHVAAGTFPTTSDFTVALTGAGVISTTGPAIPGIGVAIQSVNIQ